MRRQNQIQIIEIGEIVGYPSEAIASYPVLEAKGAELIDQIWARNPANNGEWAKDHIKPGLQLKVTVPQSRPPRDPLFAPFLEVGKQIAVDVVEGRCCNREDVVIFFPERHLHPKEIHAFMSCLTKQAPKMQRLRLMTQHPTILTEFFNHQYVAFQ